MFSITIIGLWQRCALRLELHTSKQASIMDLIDDAENTALRWNARYVLASIVVLADTIRCTAETPIPSWRAILPMPTPCLRRRSTADSRFGSSRRGRPSFLPCALAPSARR
jgi:hypothetical protein